MVKEALLKLTELLEQAVGEPKTPYGLVVGFHLIQATILPHADAWQDRREMKRLIEIIPGLGQGQGPWHRWCWGQESDQEYPGAAAGGALVVVVGHPHPSN